MTIKISKSKYLARRENARRHWLNNRPPPEELAAKFQVSTSTAYRWIKEFKQRENG